MGDLQSIEPDLPAQSPCARYGGCPVIFYKADVVFGGVDPQSSQRFKINILRVLWGWLEDDLILDVLIKAVGVFAVTPVVGADGGFHVGHVPGFRAEDAESGGWVHGSCADFGVVWLPDQAAFFGPEMF